VKLKKLNPNSAKIVVNFSEILNTIGCVRNAISKMKHLSNPAFLNSLKI